MRLLAIVLGLMPFVALETGLRLGGPGVTEGVDHEPLVNLQALRPLFVLDADSGRWIIPPERMNFFRPASFAASKPPDSKRIFVLGGSTVQGRPYSTETAFSTWLQLRLQAANPQTSFEVVNCGGVSYASYRVAKILDEVLAHQPDAIVLYTGHNEFLEDRTYADLRSMGRLGRWATAVGSKLRTVRWLRESLTSQSMQPTTLSREVDAILDHRGGLENYRRDPTWRSGVERHFHETLEQMVDRCQQADVPLIVCVPAGELVNTPPFKITRLAGLDGDLANRFDQEWQRATDKDLDISTRLAACRECLAIDPDHAGAHYIAGRLLVDRGDAEAALEHLVAARDHDVCPLRATSPIVESVQQVSSENQLPTVDTNVLLDRRDWNGHKNPDGIVDPESFVDHVHPTIAGHQRIAAEIANEIQRLGWFDSADTAEAGYQQLVVEHLSSLGEDYYARGKQRLEGLRRWASGRAGQIGID